jgi:hypothetical protein
MDRRRMRLLGIAPTKTSNDVERWAFDLTQLIPAHSEFIGEGEWEVLFKSDIGNDTLNIKVLLKKKCKYFFLV